MAWPEWDAGPYPLDDAGAGELRRDIRDELADHLESALERQRRVTSDEEEARRTVLARFGDPNKIAHQLWLQAREVQAMRERILLAFAAILTLVCLGALGLAWVALQDVRRSNEALLEKLSSLKLAAEPAAPPSDRCSVTVQLFKGQKGERPAEGLSASLIGEPAAAGQKASLSAKPDASGVVVFGPIRPGSYELRVQSPWGYGFSRSLLILAGQSLKQMVRCPETAPPSADLAFALDLPDDIRKCGPLVRAGIVPVDEPIDIAGSEWRDHKEILVTLDAGGRILPKHSTWPQQPSHENDGRSKNLGSSEIAIADKGEKPAEGFAAKLIGDASNPGEKVTLTGTSDAKGAVAFASFPPGKCQLTVRSPWGDEYRREFLMLPGVSPVEKIACPEAPPPTADVSFAIDMPEDIRMVRPLVWAAIQRRPEQPWSGDTIRVGEFKWQREFGAFVMFDVEGRLLPAHSSLPNLSLNDRSRPQGKIPDQFGLKYPLIDNAPTPLASVRLVAGEYFLGNLTISVRSFGSGGHREYEVVGQAMSGEVTNREFEARTGRPNLWKIALKPEVWSSLRNRLPR